MGQKFYNRQDTLGSDRRQSLVGFINLIDQDSDIVQKLMKENAELRQKLSCKEYEIIIIKNECKNEI
jgi:hypothetical protein